ncbi:hypothetical protein JCM8547_008645 [Rhodosporidiobolus lusitaniae]
MPCFTDLPPELLLYICELVQASGKRRYLGLVHHSLLPPACQLAFSSLIVRKYTKLAKLCDVVRDAPAVAQYIRSLVFRPSLQAVHSHPSSREVHELFSSLKSLTSLTIKRAPRIVHCLLLPLADVSPLPRLESLELNSTFDPLSNPFDPHLYLHLGTYPRLDVLTNISQEPSVPVHIPSEEDYRPLAYELEGSGSWWLTLAGPLAGNSALPDLLSFFPSIDALHLRDYQPTQLDKPPLPFLPALEALVDPDALTVLSLRERGPGAVPQ